MSKESKKSKDYIVNKDVDSVINKYLTSKELLPTYFENRIFPLLEPNLFIHFRGNREGVYEKIKDLFYNTVDSMENALNKNEIFGKLSIENYEELTNYAKYEYYLEINEYKDLIIMQREKDDYLKEYEMFNILNSFREFGEKSYIEFENSNISDFYHEYVNEYDDLKGEFGAENFLRELKNLKDSSKNKILYSTENKYIKEITKQILQEEIENAVLLIKKLRKY